MEKDEYTHHMVRGLEKRIKELEDALKLISDFGGDFDDIKGFNYNGRWCREQANKALGRVPIPRKVEAKSSCLSQEQSP